MTKALADRLAEAFAELLHKRARAEWGYGKRREAEPGRFDCQKNIAASARRPVIPPSPTTPRNR